MSRTAALLVVAALALTACAPGDPGAPEPGTPSRDGSFALELPDGWQVSDDGEDPVELVANGPGDGHLVATAFDDPEAARAEAARVAVTYFERHTLVCRPHAGFAGLELGALDCPERSRRPWVHKMLVPLRADDRSVLLLVQVEADTRAEASAVVEPIVDSFEWR